MTFTKEEQGVLKVLVEKELETIKKEGKNIFFSNSPFLGKVALDDPDVPFLKDELRYQEFLENLLKKL